MLSAPERLRLAEGVLQEAVYRARAERAGATLVPGGLEAPAGPGRCGLGAGIEGELGLTARGAELLRELFPDPPAPERLERLAAIVRDWVTRSDALDRRRNHFLRDFRAAHGADRRSYGPADTSAFEDGLARVNAEASSGLAAAAEAFLAA